MKKIILALILIVSLTGCIEFQPSVEWDEGVSHIYYENTDDYNNIRIYDEGSYAMIHLDYSDDMDTIVYAICGDNIICYQLDGREMGCIRHKDLVDKYCGMIHRGKIKVSDLKVNASLEEERMTYISDEIEGNLNVS